MQQKKLVKDLEINSTDEDDSVFDIEKKIISALFDQQDLISYAATRLTSKDFNYPIFRLCFDEIVKLYNENQKIISINLVKDRISNTDLYSYEDDLEEIFNELKYSIPLSDIEEFKQLVDIKKADAINNNLMNFANELSTLKLNTSNIEESLNKLSAYLVSVLW